MLSAGPVTNRRGVLAGGAALAALGAVSACGESAPPKPPQLEDLLGPLDQARHDSALAGAAAAAVGIAPQVTAALMVVANQRDAHARALSAEIFRVAPKYTAASSSSRTATSSPADAAAPPAPPPPLSEVVDSLRASAESAGRLVTTASGYRAGLLASIAANCTASYTVALVFPGPTP